MKQFIATFLAAAALLISTPAGVRAQAPPSAQRLEGIWIFRALFPGQSQPVYTGTARFLRDGTFSGPPNDQHSGPALGEWVPIRWGEFAFTFVANTYDDLGNFRGTSRIRGMITLSPDGLTATGRTLVNVLNSAGEVVLTRTTTFTGARVVVEPF
jgi:hypothetical protein